MDFLTFTLLSESSGGGNAPAELIFVSLFVLVLWGASRIMGKPKS